MKATKRFGLFVISFSAFGLLLIALMGLVHRSVNVRLSNGDFVRITTVSLWASVRGSPCNIVYQPKEGKTGAVIVWRNLVHQPIIVMCAADSKSLLCLYEFDTDLRLLKIDPAKAFEPFPTNGYTCLTAIVCSSPWYIEEAKVADWEYASEYLNKLPYDVYKRQVVPRLDLGIMRVGLSQQQGPIQRVDQQIKLMLESGATGWPVNWDTMPKKRI